MAVWKSGKTHLRLYRMLWKLVLGCQTIQRSVLCIFKVLAILGVEHAAGFNRVKILLWRGNT